MSTSKGSVPSFQDENADRSGEPVFSTVLPVVSDIRPCICIIDFDWLLTSDVDLNNLSITEFRSLPSSAIYFIRITYLSASRVYPTAAPVPFSGTAVFPTTDTTTRPKGQGTNSNTSPSISHLTNQLKETVATHAYGHETRAESSASLLRYIL